MTGAQVTGLGELGVPDAPRDGAPSQESRKGPHVALGYEELRLGSVPPSPLCHSVNGPLSCPTNLLV